MAGHEEDSSPERFNFKSQHFNDDSDEGGPPVRLDLGMEDAPKQSRTPDPLEDSFSAGG